MNCIRHESTDILHYGALHFAGDYLDNIDTVSKIVNRDLVDSGIDINNLCKYRVILDFRGEGQSSTDIVNLIAYLRSIPVKQVAAIFNSVVDVDQLDYPAVSVSNYLVNFAGWFDELCQYPMQWNTDCDFLCLIRRPSASRAQLASRLINADIDLRLSFGGMCSPSELTEYQPLFDQPLPLMLDGPLLRNRDDNQEHRAVSNLLRQCAVNIDLSSGYSGSRRPRDSARRRVRSRLLVAGLQRGHLRGRPRARSLSGLSPQLCLVRLQPLPQGQGPREGSRVRRRGIRNRRGSGPSSSLSWRYTGMFTQKNGEI